MARSETQCIQREQVLPVELFPVDGFDYAHHQSRLRKIISGLEADYRTTIHEHDSLPPLAVHGARGETDDDLLAVTSMASTSSSTGESMEASSFPASCISVCWRKDTPSTIRTRSHSPSHRSNHPPSSPPFGDGQTISGSCGDISHMHFTTHGRRNCAPWETCPLRSTGREEPAAVGERQFMCSMEERRRDSNAKRLPAFKIIQENLCTLDI
jgi:hypothetical protein